jgi:hypothetical protein
MTSARSWCGWQRILLQIDAELVAHTQQLQAAAPAELPLALGAMTWELLRREIGDWRRFHNRRQVASYTGLWPSEHSSRPLPAAGQHQPPRQPSNPPLAGRGRLASLALPAHLSRGR